ncbi:MAG: type II secretion system GspH family protein [Candidatus Aminicenantes bacterium]|nr:type II secretion system GspH family protein [Candidatus Aminicenantes bacterium]
MKRQGFSLIETLITLGLSAYFITATGQLLVQSLRLKQKSDAGLRTAQLASAHLERLRSLSFDHAELKAGDYEDWVADRGSGPRFRRRWTIEDATPDVKNIEIEVSAETGRVRPVRLLLCLRRDLGF